MKKIKIVFRIIFFMVLFSNAWGQEKYDAEGPIQGGFMHDTTARLLISKFDDKVTNGRYTFSLPAQSHHIAVIDIYSVAGWVNTYYIGSREDIYYYFPFPRGIYFIKVGEKVKIFYLIPGDKFEIFFLNYY